MVKHKDGLAAFRRHMRDPQGTFSVTAVTGERHAGDVLRGIPSSPFATCETATCNIEYQHDFGDWRIGARDVKHDVEDWASGSSQGNQDYGSKIDGQSDFDCWGAAVNRVKPTDICWTPPSKNVVSWDAESEIVYAAANSGATEQGRVSGNWGTWDGPPKERPQEVPKQATWNGWTVSNDNDQGASATIAASDQNISPPSKEVAKSLLDCYIDRVHAWWPFLDITRVREWLAKFEDAPHNCDDYQKYTLFMVFALGALKSFGDGKHGIKLDIKTAEMYHLQAVKYFDALQLRGLESLHAMLLLLLWELEHPKAAANDKDVWYMSRLAVSTAIDQGIHATTGSDNNGDQLNKRSGMTWWCIYSIEMIVAARLGKSPSIQLEACKIPIPFVNDVGNTWNGLPQFSVIVRGQTSVPLTGIYAMWLRKICGSFWQKQSIGVQMLGEVDSFVLQMDNWLNNADGSSIVGSRGHSKLRADYCVMFLRLVHPQPTSTWMTWGTDSSERISKYFMVSGMAAKEWQALEHAEGIAAVGGNVSAFQDVFLAGIAYLYAYQKRSLNAFDGFATQQADLTISTFKELLLHGAEHIDSAELDEHKRLYDALRRATEIAISYFLDSEKQSVDSPNWSCEACSRDRKSSQRETLALPYKKAFDHHMDEANHIKKFLSLENAAEDWFLALTNELRAKFPSSDPDVNTCSATWECGCSLCDGQKPSNACWEANVKD